MKAALECPLGKLKSWGGGKEGFDGLARWNNHFNKKVTKKPDRPDERMYIASTAFFFSHPNQKISIK